MVSRFVIETNPETRTYEPVDLHLKMEHRRSDGTKQPVAIDLVSVEMDREGLIVLTPKGADTDALILVYEVQLTERLLGSPDFMTEIERPIRVTFTARPDSESDASTQTVLLKEYCDIEIRAPGAVHWTVADDPATRDLPLEIDADGISELMLSVRYEVWDPELRKFEYDPSKVEFTHWTGPRLPADVFNAHPDDLPWEKGDDDNRDHSRWASLKELPDPGHPDLDPPIESYIRCRVWPRGTVVRLPSRIETKEGARLLAEQLIPIILRPARQIVELVDPTDPIAADGLAHQLRLRFMRERDRTPITKGSYDFEIERGASYRGGTLTDTHAELTDEHHGELPLEYTPPELTYEPNTSFTERLLVFRRTGKQRQLVSTIPLHLSPKVEIRVEAEKAGLVFEPYHVSIPAGSAPHKIRGNLVLEVHHRESGADVPFDVAHARLKAFAGEQQIGPEVRSDTSGMYQITLVELEEGLRKLPESRRIHRLDKDTQRPDCRFHEDADTVIRYYEDKTDRFAPWVLYSGTEVTKVKTHRVLLGKQLSERPEDHLPRALSATELFRTGTTFGTTWLDMYNQMFGPMYEQLKLAAVDLIAFAMNSEKFAKGLGDLLKKGLSYVAGPAGTVGRTMQSIGDGVLRGIGPRFAGLVRTISGWIDDLVRWLGVDNISDRLSELFRLARLRLMAIGETADHLQLSQGEALFRYVVEIVRDVFKLLAVIARAVVRVAVEGIGSLAAGLVGIAGAGLGAIAPGAADRLRRIVLQTGYRWHNIQEGAATTVGKMIEEIVKFVAGLSADWLVDGGPSPFGPDGSRVMGVATRGATGFLHDDVAELDVPDAADPNIESFRRMTVEMIGEEHRLLEGVRELNYIVSQVDTFVLLAELAIITVGVVCTGPIGGLALGTLTGGGMVAFDRSLAAFKVAFLRSVPLILALEFAVAMPFFYAYGTITLSGGRGDAATP